MPFALRLKKSAVALGLTAALGLGGVFVANHAVAANPMEATTWVNMRAGAGTSHAVVLVVPKNATVQATGVFSGGWYQVEYQGKRGYIYKSYLRDTTTAPTPPTPSNPTTKTTPPVTSGHAYTTAGVNIRTGPGTSYAKVGIAPRHSRVATTGVTAPGWTQVSWHGVARWISNDYLTTKEPTTATPVTGQVRTTANVYLRAEGTFGATILTVVPANTVVDATGKTTNTYTQVTYRGTTGWVYTSYVRGTQNTVSVPPKPVATGTVWVNVNELNVRATSSATGTIVGLVRRGDELKTTGVVEGDRTQVIHSGAARWVYTPFVTTTKPSTPSPTPAPPESPTGLRIPSYVTTSGMSKLTPSAKKVVQATVDNYPKIRTIYGWRASSKVSTSDHPYGRAVDIMMPGSYSTYGDYGWEIAHYFQRNAKQYNIKYIIFGQKIWNASYPQRGWRQMEDRGSITDNHYDHVHISVNS